MTSRLFLALVLASTHAAPAGATAFPSAGSVDASTLALPSAPASVRGLAGDATVSVFTGQVSYAVPIELPPGRGQFAPALELMYEGALGNGPLGVGWTLGVPSIRRSTRMGVPRYDDPSSTTLDWARADELELVGIAGGGRLVPVRDGTWRVEGRGEDIRVEFSGSVATVTDRDGVVYHLGTTPAGRLFDASRGVFAWYAQAIQHPSGETIVLRYARDRGQVYLDSVAWANQGTATAPDYRYQAVLTWEARSDAFASYRTGFAVTTARRLRSLAVMARNDATAADEVARRYELTYDETLPLSRLVSVLQVGRGGVGALPAASFGYGASTPATTVQFTGNAGWQLSDASVALLDVDGDGLSDLVRFDAARNAIYYRRNLANSTGPSYAFDAERVVPSDILALPTLGNDSRFMGMQGKGRPELVRRVGNSWQVQRLEGQQLISLGAWGGTTNLALFGAGIAFADLNGDERADMLAASGTNLQYRLNGAAALDAVRTAAVAPPVVPGGAGVRFQDMNGDGLADAVSISLAAGTALVYPGRGDGTFDAATTIALPAPRPGDASDVRFADLNRDGVADVVYVSSSAVTWYPARPDGTLLAAVQLAPPSAAVNPVVGLADMNGNGSEDVVWSAGGTLWALDLAGTTTAAMLTSIGNGLGQTTAFAYDASAMLALRAEAAAQPWAERLPISVPVPTTVTTTLASGGPPRSQQLTVRDGFWDGDERQFGGFLEGTRTYVGDAPGSTLLERSLFNAGRGADRVLRGTPRRIERRDQTGALLQVEDTDWEALRVPSFPVDVPGLRRAVARERRVLHHEGQVAPVVVRTRFGFDAEGNVVDEQRDGRLDRTGDEVHVTRVFASNPARNVRGRVVEERVENASGLAALTRTYYDGASFPYAAGVAPLAFGTVDRGWPRRIDGFLASAGRWVTSGSSDYDARGNVTGRYADGVARTLGYDAAGMFPISESVAPTAATTLTWTATWDSVVGRLVGRGDPNGVAHAIGYDSLGRITSLALGSAPPYQTYSYLWSSPRPRTMVVASDGGAGTRTVAHVFDSRGEPLYDADRATPAQWIVRAHTARDARGAVRFVAEPYFHNSATLPTALPASPVGATTVRDALGRAAGHTLSNGAVQTIARNPLEEIVSYPGLAPVTRRLDGQARIYRTERTVGTTIESVDAEYDAAGRVTRLALQGGAVAHTYGYDTLGHLVSAGDPDIGPRALTWFDSGRLATLTNGRGDVISFSYDAAGRLTRRSTGTLIYDYHYDLPRTGDAAIQRTLGRLAYADEPQGDTVAFRYDDFGRESARRRTIAGVTAEEIRAFSPAGFLLSHTTDDGFSATFQYDAAGRLSAIPGTWTLLTADPAGRTSSERFGNGAEQTYERDALGLPTTIRLTLPGTPRPTTPYSVLVTRNLYGAPTAVTDVDGVGRDQTASFAYDQAGRISRSTTGGATINYAYDGLQNLTARTGPALPIATGTYRYAERGFGPRQLTSVGALTFDYDLAGRAIRRGTTTMQWDAFDRLVRADVSATSWVEHRYGYDGERTYTRDAAGAIERRFSPSLVERAGHREHYLRSGDRVLAKIAHVGAAFTPTYLHTGVGAGPAAFSNATGQLTDERIYEPYGALLAGSLAPDPLGGLNKPVDAVTGWSDHGARWMSSEIARWLAPDPIVKGPDARFLAEPWALHPYGYVLNNPTLYWDPDGRQEKTAPQPDATQPEPYSFGKFIVDHWKNKIEGWLGKSPVKVPVGPATLQTDGHSITVDSVKIGNVSIKPDGPGDAVGIKKGWFSFLVKRGADGSGEISTGVGPSLKTGPAEVSGQVGARLVINAETTENHNVGALEFFQRISVKIKGIKVFEKIFEQSGGPVGLPGGLSEKLDRAQQQREAAGEVKEGGGYWHQCASGQCR